MTGDRGDRDAGEALDGREGLPAAGRLVGWSGRDTRFVLICLVLLTAGLAIGLRFYSRAFPDAALELKVTRDESREIAEKELVSRGLHPAEPGSHQTSVFYTDDEARVFLERTLGLEEANRRIATGLPIWGFEHRWFVPERKEEWRARVGADGRLVEFRHVIEERQAGASLDLEEARSLAASAAAARQSPPADPVAFISGMRSISAESHDRPRRRDHSFVWEKPSTAVNDGALRIEVEVQGDRVGGYREFFFVPEKWSDDYQTLRSKNSAAGQVASLGLGITLLAALGTILLRMKRHDLPTKLAYGFAVVGFVLLAGNSLNSLSFEIHGYQTEDSFAGFLSKIGFSIAAISILSAGILYLFGLAGEPLDAERYTFRLPLRTLFSRRGLATKTVPKSIILGFALAGIFLAYQVVFYLVADRLGAWSPADVPYSDLLNTKFPWIAVLFIGFYPAVSEEFISRLFSISWLEKLTGKRWVAVVVSAMVWGFAHSTYPNQPFFIRGLEVGLAGIVIGFVYIRFGVLATLVWHYTVDAGYTSVLLFRSPNPAYRATAAVAAFGLVIPLLVSVVLAIRRKGFVDEQQLMDEVSLLRREIPEFRGREAVEAEHEPAIRAVRHPIAPVAAGVALVAGLALFLPGGRIGNGVLARIDAEGAKKAAREFVQKKGIDLTGHRSVVARTTESVDGEEVKFLLDASGVETLESFAAGRSLYQVRFFRPLQKDEWHVGVRGDGKVTGWTRILPDEASGAKLAEADAEALAMGEARSFGDDLTGWKRAEAKKEEKKNRVDYEFTFERTDPIGWPSGSAPDAAAKLRRIYRVSGHDVTVRRERLKLPENWLKARRGQTAFTWVRIAALLLSAGLLTATLVLLFVRAARAGRILWRPLLLLAAGLAAFHRIELIDRWRWFVVYFYDTSTPWGSFLITWGVGAIVGFGISLGAIVLAFGAFDAAIPGAADARRLTAGWKRNVAAAGAGPLFAVLAGGGAVSIVEWSRVHFERWLPAEPYPLPGPLDGVLPLLTVMSGALVWGLVLPAAVLAVAALREKYSLGRFGLLAGLVAAGAVFTPMTAITVPEWGVAAGEVAILLALLWFVSSRLLFDNPFAYFLTGCCAKLLAAGFVLASQPAASYRFQGGMAIAAGIALLFLPLFLRSRGEIGLGVSIPVRRITASITPIGDAPAGH